MTTTTIKIILVMMIIMIMLIIIIMTCQLHLAPAEFLLIRFQYFMDLLLAGTQWGWLWGWGLCPWAALDTSGRVIWTLYDIWFEPDSLIAPLLVALQPQFFDWLVTLRTSCQRKRNPPCSGFVEETQILGNRMASLQDENPSDELFMVGFEGMFIVFG